MRRPADVCPGPHEQGATTNATECLTNVQMLGMREWFSIRRTARDAELGTMPVRVLEASVAGATELDPGLAKLTGSELVVGCVGGSVSLKRVQPAGKKVMSGADWFRGLRRDSLLLS